MPANTVRRRAVPGAWDGSTRYGCRVQGATHVALSLLDVLGYLNDIPICIAYQIDGKTTTRFPESSILDRARPVYERLPGWRCDLSGIRTFDALPENAKKVVLRIEQLVQTPIKWISVGPRRDEIIEIP